MKMAKMEKFANAENAPQKMFLLKNPYKKQAKSRICQKI